MATITESELLEALRTALQGSEDVDGAMTVGELSEALEWTSARVREVLKLLKKQGQLAVVRVPREALDGARRPVPAYRFVGESPIGGGGGGG